MPAKKPVSENENPNAHDVAVVVTADICQIIADTETHPDENARERIMRCLARLEDIVAGNMTPDLATRIRRAGELLRQETA